MGRGDTVEAGSVNSAIGPIAAPAFWDEPRNCSDVVSWMPEYRLSMFQRPMKDWAASELIAGYLLDVDGVVGFLSASYS